MHEHDDDEDLRPSKSQIKREMHALQALGQQLLELDEKTLDKCQLPDNLARALEEYKRLPNSHGARKRQLQYIGKVMRDIDTSHIRATLEGEKQEMVLANRRFQALEAVREQLLAGDEKALEGVIEGYPGVDIQHLRQLVRQAQKEQSAGKGPAAARKLFRYLRELDGA